MKNNKRNVLFIMAIMILSISLVNVNAQQKNTNVEITEEVMEKNYNMLVISDKIQKQIYEYYNIKDIYNDKYPSYYGGIYIDNNKENVIIQIVKDKIPNVLDSDYEFYRKLISYDNSIKIEYVKNSFNSLNDGNNICIKNIGTLYNIYGCHIDVINNIAVVELLKNNNEPNKVLKLFEKERISKNVVRISEVEVSSPSTDIYSGGKILRVSNDPNNYCSMGFRTKYNGYNGYVTAGHCAIGYSSFPSGTITLSQFANSQYYDYAFVKTNSSYTPTNYLAYHPTNMTKIAVINYSYALSVGLSIGKAGVKTGYTTGQITALNQAILYDTNNDGVGDTTIYGLCISNLYQGPGDSGGIVLVPRSDSNGGGIPIGILSGGIPYSNEMYFTQMSTLPSQLVLNTY